MAQIVANTGETIYRINKWLGLNENPDGDTQLKPGEAAEMRNFKITRDGNLQKRPGIKTAHTSGAKTWTGAIKGIWHGNVATAEYTVFAAGGDLYVYNHTSNTAASILDAGATLTDAPTFFFGMSEKLYIMTGTDYLVWNGTTDAINVVGYIPITFRNVPPAGGGDADMQVNKLTPKRRILFNSNGSAVTYQLPEAPIDADTDADVILKHNGVTMTPTTDYTVNKTTGVITTATAYSSGTNTVEITYSALTDDSATVLGMRFAEIYNGSTDNRVFLYGDGTNMAIYSGLDEFGQESAEYFPDLNVLRVGEENTAITSMIRHYSRLAVYKEDSAYSVNYGQITLVDGNLTAAFFIVTTNRSIGNSAPGMTQLVNNSPRTLFGGSIYEWRNNASYSSNLTVDERQAQLVSQRVFRTLSGMTLSSAFTFDDNERQEYYVIQNGTAVIHNYNKDAWYVYTTFDITMLFVASGELYGCTSTGNIVHISRTYKDDNGTAIDCYWRSGSIDFGKAWQRKYASRIFITVKPESRAYVLTTVLTNRKTEFPEKEVLYAIQSFIDMDFRHFSFGTNLRPQVERLKIKAKKFAYYQIIFKTEEDWNTATVLQADIKVRYTGDVK